MSFRGDVLSMSGMKNALMEISGIGDVKASQIIEVVEAHQSENDTVTEALAYMDQGDYAYAEDLLRREFGE